jgi:hypothetical protein
MQNAKFDFGEVLRLLKRGERVCRTGWNGKGMFLALVSSDDWKLVDDGGFTCDPREIFGLLPWIGMKTADDKIVPWLASQTDILSEDWEVVP